MIFDKIFIMVEKKPCAFIILYIKSMILKIKSYFYFLNTYSEALEKKIDLENGSAESKLIFSHPYIFIWFPIYCR